MADENLEGKVRITFDEKPAVESTKKVADAIQNLDKRGSASVENLAKKLETRMGEAAARVAVSQKKLETELARGGNVTLRTNENIRFIREREESNKRLIQFRKDVERQMTVQQQVAAADRFRARNPGFMFANEPLFGPSREQPFARRQRLAAERAERLEQLSVQRQIREADRFRTLNPNFELIGQPTLGPMALTPTQIMRQREAARQQASIDRQIAAADRFRTLNPGYMSANQAVQGPYPEPVWVRRRREAEERTARRERESVERQIREADRFRTMNPNYMNMRGGGGGGFFGGIGRRLSGLGGGGIAGSIVGGLAGGFGLGLGGYALANAARGMVEAAQAATAYDRQQVAAEKLAGSQQKLNALMDAYAKASGG